MGYDIKTKAGFFTKLFIEKIYTSKETRLIPEIDLNDRTIIKNNMNRKVSLNKSDEQLHMIYTYNGS